MSSLDTFHLSLDDFEGPLPLLLHLIEKNELQVTRVSIAAVADQFIALVAASGSTELSTMGEFIAVAARLLLIKSRAILLRDVAPEDAFDDAETLRRQIAEYSRYQAVGRAIARMFDSDTFTRPRPQPLCGPTKVTVMPIVRSDRLVSAARRLLVQAKSLAANAEHWPDVNYVSVRSELLADMRRIGKTTFGALCRPEWHPLVVVTMFLAVLDAVRSEQLTMWQPAPFGEIELATAGPGTVNA